ncbi:MAG TPA: S24 family peptidase [Thermoanaerobaculia bacterium]|nr:S24 family peptidase [Thermoanaerobaculia bacterium]
MSPRRDHSEQMRRLAAILERRITEFDSRHRRRYRKTPAVSKILNDRTHHPGLFTVQQIANDLETTVGDLLSEPVLGEADLQKLRDFVDFLIERFDLMGARAAATRAGAFAIPETEFVERDYDYPRPHHVFLVPHAAAAAGSGIEADRDTEITEVLHSIRDVYNGQLRVIKVIGDSMLPVLHDGDKVIVDIRRTAPRDGEVVAVYHHTDGGSLGYWRSGENGEFWLDKANAAFNSIRLDISRDWTLWGTATRIVDTPVGVRSTRSR